MWEVHARLSSNTARGWLYTTRRRERSEPSITGEGGWGWVATVNGWGCARRCHLAVEDAEEGEIVVMLVGSSCRAAVRLTGKGRRQAGEDGDFSSGLWGRGGKHNGKLFEKSCWSYVLISRTGSLRVADGSALRECNEGHAGGCHGRTVGDVVGEGA
jgi:hypothetical protein